MENTKNTTKNTLTERDIQKALKGMLDHVMILNDDEKLSSDTLITMAVDALFEDEEYGSFVDKNSERAYLQQISDALSKKGLTFYDVNILEIEICSECGVILLPDDECYESHNGSPLCAGCSYRCECCDQYFKKEEVSESANGYSCKSCELKYPTVENLNVVDSSLLNNMTLEQFEKHDGNFTFSTGIKPAIGQGVCLPNMVHCKVEGAYEKFFANRKDAFENIVKQNHYVPHAYIELNNGFDKSLLECIKLPQAVNELTNANDYTTRQLLEKEFQNVPNSTHKDNLIAEALQLVEVNGYTVGEAANEVLAENTSFVGLPELISIRDTFLTYVGKWSNGKDCRTGENREDGTVTYLMDGLYLYEFKTREDAFKYLFDDNRSVPYAMAEYDEELTQTNGEETFGEWEFHNGFNPEWLKQKLTPRYCIVQNTEENGSSTLEDYDTLEKAMEAYNYIKENGCHKNENDDEIMPLESGTKISMDIEWWTYEYNSFVKHEGINVPVITISSDNKKKQLLSLIVGMSINSVNIIDISKEKIFEDFVDVEDATFQIFTQDGTITVDWGEGESGIDVYADSSVNEELVKAFRYQMFPFLTMDQVFDYFQSKK